MTTITDFLLARIAEDEERARFVARQIEGNNWTPHEPWKLSWHDEYDLLCIEPSRALTECETRRRIVMSCSEMQMSGVELAAYLATQTIRTLALVYADHPDFRPGWRSARAPKEERAGAT